MAAHLQKHIHKFDRQGFESGILQHLEKLELKQRALLIADQVHKALPHDNARRARILGDVLHPHDADRADQPSDENGLSGWAVFPLTLVVGQYGVDDFDRSLVLLKRMTSRFSSEFAIRYFLLADQDRTLALLRGWLDDPNQHVRRLVSEGTRPRLPWAMQLPQLINDPTPMLPFLKALSDDGQEYVRRSVANHLNDIAKDHPDLVADLAMNWMTNAGAARIKLVRHACRTLIKQGHPKALAAFGFEKPLLQLDRLVVSSATVELGSGVKFQADLRSTASKPQMLVIDYLVHFQKANGKLAAKVFKGKRLALGAGETFSFQKFHAIRPISTRRYHAGLHAVSVRINGEDFGHAEFNLLIPTKVLAKDNDG